MVLRRGEVVGEGVLEDVLEEVEEVEEVEDDEEVRRESGDAKGV